MMKIALLYLAVSSAFCKAQFNIDVEVDGDGNGVSSWQGSFERGILDSDRAPFGIASEKDLIDLICNLSFSCPANVDVIRAYLRPSDFDSDWPDPSYYQYKADVKAKLIPVKVEVQSQTEPSTLKRTVLRNNGNVAGTFVTEINEEVSDTYEDNWSDTYGLQFEQKFTYDAKFLGSGGGGETSIGFTGEWAKGGSNSSTYTVGSKSGVSVYLEPGESAVVHLEARRGTATVKTTYQVELFGRVSWVTRHKENGALVGSSVYDIQDLLRRNGMPNVKQVTQEAHFGVYSDAYITLDTYADARTASPISHDVIPGEKILENNADDANVEGRGRGRNLRGSEK